MRKRTKQHGLSMLAGLLMMAMLAGWMLSGPFEVEAVDATEVASSDALFTAISGDSDIDVDIKLTGNIAVSEALVWGKNSTLTIDLNGCTLSGENNSGVLELTSGTLTITDSSTGGTITSTASSVGTIEVTGGTLNITGGSIQSENYVAVNADSNMNADSKTTVTVENGTLEGNFAALKIGNNCSVTIGKNGGNPVLCINATTTNGGSTIIMQPSVNASASTGGSELVILGGEFSANTSGDFCYVCSVSGESNKVTVSGGTFTLNADSGSTLVIGADMKDSNVSISGGIYNGRIARMITKGTAWDYSVYYGGGPFDGIIASRSMLTNNSLCDNGENAVFTADNVSVVPGAVLMFNTRRSSLETYEESDKESANSADFLSISPIVKKDGTIEINSDANEIPTVEKSKIPEGNTYTFRHWIDSNNRVYASSADYLAQNSLEGNTTLRAVWTASCTKPDGFYSATNCSAVSTVSGNLVQKTEYTLGTGSWTVTGDNTVYSGGQSFYVTESGNYGFQRR